MTLASPAEPCRSKTKPNPTHPEGHHSTNHQNPNHLLAPRILTSYRDMPLLQSVLMSCCVFYSLLPLTQLVRELSKDGGLLRDSATLVVLAAPVLRAAGAEYRAHESGGQRLSRQALQRR
jgi:hypothetical protein